MKQKERGAIIFDFDGTIADSFSVALDIFYSLGRIRPLRQSEITRLKGLALLQVARELKVPRYMVPFLLIRGRKAMHKRMGEVGMEPGMDKVIKQLSKRYKLFILSSNSPENITEFLNRYDLLRYFEAVQGNARLLGKSRKLQKMIVQYKLDRTHTWYVGDEARDIEAAHKGRVKSMAVTWGYNNKRALARHRPDVLVETAHELLHSIKNNGV